MVKQKKILEKTTNKKDADVRDAKDTPRIHNTLTPEQPIVPAFETASEPPPEANLESEVVQERETKKEEGFLDEAKEAIRGKLHKQKSKKIKKVPQVRDELTVHIEHIMEEGLSEAYRELNTVEQQEFKMKGEETALKIRELLKSTHVRIKRIFKLLFEWLKVLPGVNRFFLVQEAKIKADKIMTLKKTRPGKK